VDDLSTLPTVLLVIVAGAAGFVDAIAGGGGLLTLPALLIAGLPPHLAMGTNKGQSVFGSGTALIRYAHSPLLDRTRVIEGFPSALVAGAIGTVMVMQVPPKALSVVVMVLLVAVAIFMIVRKPAPGGQGRIRRAWWVAAIVAAVIAGYDGFFGPGTGTFLIMAYVALWHDPLDAASANAKVVNFGSNLSSVIVFGLGGLVAWKVAVPMAVAQIIGGYAGAHLTVRRGQGLVRWLVVAVSLALVIRMAWQLFE